MSRLLLPALLLLLVAGGGCAVPYSVGATAETVRPGAVVQRSAIQFASAQPDLRPAAGSTEPTTSTVTFDQEVRFGLDDASDAGVRLVGTDGVVASYRRRLGMLGVVKIAGTVGAGVVGFGSHGHFEATLALSPEVRGALTPYGGLRAQALVPLGDGPEAPVALGAFGGVRLASGDLAIYPELGVFYAPTEPFRGSDWIIVPSITIAGDRLLRALGIGG
ncbi:MAG TPA: hypothetical protein VK610_08400 [Rhodothermales bacterium]|nr:hypothetical protein [Rhodothermales bacterium]